MSLNSSPVQAYSPVLGAVPCMILSVRSCLNEWMSVWARDAVENKAGAASGIGRRRLGASLLEVAWGPIFPPAGFKYPRPR